METAVKILVSYFGAYDASVGSRGRGYGSPFWNSWTRKKVQRTLYTDESQDEKFDMRTQTAVAQEPKKFHWKTSRIWFLSGNTWRVGKSKVETRNECLRDAQSSRGYRKLWLNSVCVFAILHGKKLDLYSRILHMICCDK